MKNAQISVISIPVRDQDRAKAFYVDKLGFVEELDSTVSDSLRWVILRPPGGGTAIMLVTWLKSLKPGSMRGIVLEVPDIEETIRSLTSRGVLIDGGSLQEGPWGHWVTLEDPDGNGWLIQQYATEGSSSA